MVANGVPHIAVRGVELRRGGLVVLHEATCALGPGVWELRGPNGSGKSSLLRALAGVLPPARGRIEICGHDIERDGVAARRRLGFLPETTDFFPHLTGREFLQTVAALRGGEREQAFAQFVELAGPQVLAQAIGSMSAGQRRKLGLCAAVTGEPDVLLLDEPANTLDKAALAALEGIVADWATAGRCVVLALHQSTFASRPRGVLRTEGGSLSVGGEREPEEA